MIFGGAHLLFNDGNDLPLTSGAFDDSSEPDHHAVKFFSSCPSLPMILLQLLKVPTWVPRQPVQLFARPGAVVEAFDSQQPFLDGKQHMQAVFQLIDVRTLALRDPSVVVRLSREIGDL